MKKASLAFAVLAASTSAAWAQSSVTLYGIVDAAVRYTTNANPGQSQKQLIPGGMSQSRLGINVTEDMGGGLKALANMEHRLQSDTGASASATDFWRQAWVGLQSNDLGQIRLGRQYNILFDAYTSTFASFRYSPYIEAYKPELGMALGARQSNMVKYLADVGGLRVELQASAGENSAGADKTIGGLVRYATGPFAMSGAYLQAQEAAGGKVKEWLFGASYTEGPWYVHAAYADNKFDTSVSAATRVTYTGGLPPAHSGGTPIGLSAASANVSKRTMLMAGVTYQLTAQFNLGATYWHVNQDPLVGTTDSKGNFYAAVADYALSKRTDAYLEVDLTKFNGNLAFLNGATKRGGAMVGVRHRF